MDNNNETHSRPVDVTPHGVGSEIAQRCGYSRHVDADIVIPVYNEEHTLARCITTHNGYLSEQRQSRNSHLCQTHPH